MDVLDWMLVIQLLIILGMFYLAYKLGDLEGKVEGFIENHRKN